MPLAAAAVLPAAHVEVLAPAVEARAAPPGLLDQPVGAGPAARQGRLHDGRRHVVERHAHAARNAPRAPAAGGGAGWLAPANGSSSNGVCALGT